MDPLATPAALGNWLGETLVEDDARALAVLDHASSLVRIAAATTWLSPAVIPDGIPQLVVRIAARLWLNPGGLKSSTTGPFSGTFANAELTGAERGEIDDILTPGRRRIGTISTTRGPLETRSVFADSVGSTIYVDVVGSDEPLPVGVPE